MASLKKPENNNEYIENLKQTLAYFENQPASATPQVNEDEAGPSPPPQPYIGKKKFGALVNKSMLLKPIKEDIDLSNKLLRSINSGYERKKYWKRYLKK